MCAYFLIYICYAALFFCIYRGRLSVVDVPRLQTESDQMAPTSPSALSHSAWSSAPWGLLRYPREQSNLLPLMARGPARPDRLRQDNNYNLELFTLILYGVEVRCDRKRFSVRSPHIETSKVIFIFFFKYGINFKSSNILLIFIT